MKKTIAAILVVLSMSGCADDPPPPRSIAVSAADYGEKWPLVASQANIGCEPPSRAYVEIAGRRCALNGKALTAGMERCDDASKTGNAVAFSVFIEKALGLCPGRN